MKIKFHGNETKVSPDQNNCAYILQKGELYQAKRYM